MIEVKFYDKAADDLLKFAVIIARQDGKWIFCKHKQRDTYELPGGTVNPARPFWKQRAGSCRKKQEPLILQSSRYASTLLKGKQGSTRMQRKKPMGCCMWQTFSRWGKSTAR